MSLFYMVYSTLYLDKSLRALASQTILSFTTNELFMEWINIIIACELWKSSVLHEAGVIYLRYLIVFWIRLELN